MESLKNYFGRPEQEIFRRLDLRDVPESSIAIVKCVDCGKNGIAAGFFYLVDLKNWTMTGPHCGCKEKS